MDANQKLIEEMRRAKVGQRRTRVWIIWTVGILTAAVIGELVLKVLL